MKVLLNWISQKCKWPPFTNGNGHVWKTPDSAFRTFPTFLMQLIPNFRQLSTSWVWWCISISQQQKLRGGDKLAPAPANSLDHTMIQKLRTLFMHQKKSFHVYQKSEQFIPEIHVQIQPIAPTELYILISGIRREHDIPFALGFPLKPFFSSYSEFSPV